MASTENDLPDYSAIDSIALTKIVSTTEWAYAAINRGLAQFEFAPGVMEDTIARLELMDLRSLQRVRASLDGQVIDDLTEEEQELKMDFFPLVYPHPKMVKFFEDMRDAASRDDKDVER